MESNVTDTRKDYLWLHLRELPYFRSLMRAVEASYYPGLTLPEPVLDIGCGDGHFVTVAFERKVAMGLDPSMSSLKEAAWRGGYKWLCQADGAKMPYKDGSFASAISNSVLEHILQIDPVLEEIKRVLRPGAPFVFCGPNHRFLEALSIGRSLDQFHLQRVGDFYRKFFDRISRHYHSDAPTIWGERLVKAGFYLEKWWYYYPPDALQVTEWGHVFGLPSLFWRTITGKWILAQTHWNLWPTERYTRRHYHPDPCEDGVCTFYAARRI
jgi:SAM-dependent methyltransferase